MHIELEVQNQTKWPWKKGCYLAAVEGHPFKIEKVGVAQKVKGNDTVRIEAVVGIPGDIDFKFIGTNEVTF